MKLFLLFISVIFSFYAVYSNYIMNNAQVIYIGLVLFVIGSFNFNFRTFLLFSKNWIYRMFLGFFFFYLVHFNFEYKSFDVDSFFIKNMLLEIIGIFVFLILFILVLGQKRVESFSFYIYAFLLVSFLLELLMHFLDYNSIYNKNFYAYHAFLLVVYMHLRNIENKKIFLFGTLILLLITFFSFQSRSTTASIIVYIFFYFNYSRILKTKSRLILISLIYFFILGFSIYYYTFIAVDNDFLINLNSEGEKGVFGRLPVWVELFRYIGDKPWWGYGSNISSEYVYSDVIGRTLSSHNSYLDLLFRNGVLGFTFFIILWIQIIRYFYKNRHSKFAPVGISLLFSSLWMASAYEIIFFTIMTVNLFYWVAFAILVNCIENETKEFSKKNTDQIIGFNVYK
jgi:O-antigen ligase